MINPFRSIARVDLIEEAKVWFYFISYVLRPFKYSWKRGGNPPLRIAKRLQDKCGKNY